MAYLPLKSAIFLWKIVCFLTRSKAEFFLNIPNCETLFLIKSYFNWVEKKVAYSQHQFENQLKKMHVTYGSWSSWKDKSSFNFDIGCLGFYLSVAITMISKRFFKLNIILYYKTQQQIWSKDDSESSLKFTFAQDCWKWDFARPNSKPYFSKFPYISD